MHAVVINVTFADRAAATGELSGLVPRVSSAPGFVAGYWISLAETKGTSTVVFDSQESAQAFVEVMQGMPPMSVTVDSVEVGEVMASA
jgi:hypothetical protein